MGKKVGSMDLVHLSGGLLVKRNFSKITNLDFLSD
jgi:hypothetical protein